MNTTQQQNEVEVSSIDFHANLHKEHYALYFWHLIGIVFSRPKEESMKAIKQMQGNAPWATCTDEFIVEVARVGVENIILLTDPLIKTVVSGKIVSLLSSQRDLHGVNSNYFSEDGVYWHLFTNWLESASGLGIKKASVFGQFVLHRIHLLWTGEKEYEKCFDEQRIFFQELTKFQQHCIVLCFLTLFSSCLNFDQEQEFYRAVEFQLQRLIEESQSSIRVL